METRKYICFPCGPNGPVFEILKNKQKPVKFTFQQKPSYISRDTAAELIRKIRKAIS